MYRSLVSWLLIAAALGCAAAPALPPPPPVSSPGRTVTSRMTRVPDANSAALLLASHNVVLAAARIATTRAQHREVKLLARSLVTDHTTMSATLSRVLAGTELTPRDDDVTALLRDQSAARRDTLRTLSGSAFDSAYVTGEVRYHQELLVAIDRVLIPSVRNAQLRDYVSSIRPAIAGHLELAEQVQTTILRRR